MSALRSKYLILELTLCGTIVCITKFELCFNSNLDLSDEFVMNIFMNHDVVCADACLSFSGFPGQLVHLPLLSLGLSDLKKKHSTPDLYFGILRPSSLQQPCQDQLLGKRRMVPNHPIPLNTFSLVKNRSSTSSFLLQVI